MSTSGDEPETHQHGPAGARSDAPEVPADASAGAGTGPPRSLRPPAPGPSSASPAHHLLEPPDPVTGRASLTVERSFAFVDVCGFTSYCERFGEHLALELLIEFRQITRAVVARRGVRVSKWLGDGAMIVGLDATTLAAACVEIGLRCDLRDLDTHAGIATGPVLLLEGDDYVGRTLNLAARLCDAAAPGETLAAGPLPAMPPWLEVRPVITVDLHGMDEPVEAHRLVAADDIRRSFAATSNVA